MKVQMSMIKTHYEKPEKMSTTFQITNIQILNYKHPNFNPILFLKIHLTCVRIMEEARNVKMGRRRKAYSGIVSIMQETPCH